MKCIQCNLDYESKRATSKYCSAKCRVTANRDSVTKDSVTPLSVTKSKNAKDLQVSANKTLDKWTSDTVSQCPEVEHAQGCLSCLRLRKEKKDDTLQCNGTYVNCKQWGVCINSYHQGMCTTT